MLHALRYLRSRRSWERLGSAGAQLIDDFAFPRPRGAQERARALSRACAAACRLHALETTVEGPLPSEPAILVCNHLGYVDPVVICAHVPCTPIAKSELSGWPLLGGVIRRLNVILVRRGDAHSGARALLAARRCLERGVSVLNFPEGTTTRGQTLPFRRGVFGLARLVGVPVVPLALSFEAPDLCWVDDETFAGHYATRMVGHDHRVRIQLGPPHYALEGESAEEFAARLRTWIERARSRFEFVRSPVTSAPTLRGDRLVA